MIIARIANLSVKISVLDWTTIFFEKCFTRLVKIWSLLYYEMYFLRDSSRKIFLPKVKEKNLTFIIHKILFYRALEVFALENKSGSFDFYSFMLAKI